MSMFVSEIALFLNGRFSWNNQPFGVREVGVFFTISGLGNIFTQFVLIRPVSRWLSDRALGLSCFALLAAAFTGLGFTRSVALLGLLIGVISLGTALLRPTLTSLLSAAAAPEKQGLIMGGYQSMIAGANIVAPLVSGCLINAQLYLPWVLAMAGLFLAGLILTGIHVRSQPKAQVLSAASR
jgi:MFS transporter, DHA1 family, tetracycline resistance protein